MPDLSTVYMGLTLRNPLVVGSSTHTTTARKITQLAEAGAGAVVLKSIFEEQIRAEVASAYDELADAMHTEAYEYLRANLPMEMGPEKYLERLQEAKGAADIPVIASVNCIHGERWIHFAKKIEAAGADALELNVYDIPDDPGLSADDIEKRHLELIGAVRREVSLPVAVKLGPYYSSLLHFARRVAASKIDALVLFNRFFQPDINIDSLEIENVVNLSRSEDIRLPLRWIALLRDEVDCSLALTTGVHNSEGMLKALLAGADAVQICSVLYRQSRDAIGIILDGVREWMERKEFETIGEFRGMLRQKNLDGNPGFERAQYMKTLVGQE